MISSTKPRTVLIYAPCVGGGGVRRLVLRLLDAFLRMADPGAWRFRVLSHLFDGHGDELPWPQDIFLPLSQDKEIARTGVDLCEFLQSNQNRFWEELQRHAGSVDVIWLPMPWWTLRVTEHRVDLPAHIIPTVHDFAFDELGWDGLFGDRFRDEFRTFLAVSSRLIFSSACMAERAIEGYGMPPPQGRVIHLADFVPATYSPTPSEAARVSAKFTLPSRYWLAFHAMGHKDPQTILAALARTKQQLAEADFIPLVIAGLRSETLRPDTPADGSLTVAIRKFVKDLGLIHGRDYHALGFVPDDDIAGLYAGATGCVVASRSEAGLSASIFEALQARVPLIHSDIAPFVERLGTDDRFAIRFRVGDADDLAKGMLQVMMDPAAATEKAYAGHDAFCHRTWEDVAQDYLRVFEEACAEGPSSRVWMPPVDSIQNGERVGNRTLSVRVHRLFRRVLGGR